MSANLVLGAAYGCRNLAELATHASRILGRPMTANSVRCYWQRERARRDAVGDTPLPRLRDVLGGPECPDYADYVVSYDDVIAPATDDSPHRIGDPVDTAATPYYTGKHYTFTYTPPAPTPPDPAPPPQPATHAVEWSTPPFKADSVYRVIVIPDMQVPYHDPVSLAAVEKYMADETWDEYINLGDFLDLDCISSHNKGKPRLVEGKSIAADFAVGNEILDRHEWIIRARNKDARFVLLEGNHEYRAERYIDEHPAMRGSMEVETGLRLRERGFKWVRCYQKGEVYKLGKAYFHHGLITSGNHAKAMADRFGVNIFYGHVHSVDSWSKVQWGKDQTIVGQSLGCLCEYEQSYIKGNPTNWQQAVCIFFFLPDGHFTYYVPRIFNHRFVAPNGKTYSANRET